MLYTQIRILPNGPVLGYGGQGNIRSCRLTESVNEGQELTLGSVCTARVQVVAQVEGLEVAAGTEAALYKIDPAAGRTLVGTFTLERPVRMGKEVWKIVGYDHGAKLDKDLSQWLKGLTGWPYDLLDFASQVCRACGVELATTAIPNGSFPVEKFYRAQITGRRLMEWVGQLSGRFCRADAQGRICLDWYRDTETVVSPSGERYQFQGSLRYGEYEVAPIDGVKVRLTGSQAGLLWPEGDKENPYVIGSNPIALARVDQDLTAYLDTVAGELAKLRAYRPCQVTVPACVDIRPGDRIGVETPEGLRFYTYVMKKTQVGQRETLVCTGSPDRGGLTLNSRLDEQIQEVVDRQTQAEIFEKLTDGRADQGLFLDENGDLYLNLSRMVTGTLSAEYIDVSDLVVQALVAESADATLIIDNSLIHMEAADGSEMRIYYNNYPEMFIASENRVCRLGAAGMDFSIGIKDVAGICLRHIDGEYKGLVYAEELNVGGVYAEWNYVNGVRTLVAKGSVV